MASLQPTPEQEAILDAVRQGDNLVIEAGAGTGKTSTLKLIAEANPAIKILYVAYNRAAKDDAQRRMPANVKTVTSHGLAYQAVGRMFRDRLRGGRPTSDAVAEFLRITDPLDLGDDVLLSPAAQASLVMRTLDKFAQSADDHILARHVPQVPNVSEQMQDDLAAHLLPYARRAWESVRDPYSRATRFTHDYYLKLWQLSDPKIAGYDLIVVDEAQDTNPVAAAIYRGQTHLQQVAVGDSYQSLYEWRGARNALADWPASNRLFLTRSWRFGPVIALAANAALRRLGGVALAGGRRSAALGPDVGTGPRGRPLPRRPVPPRPWSV